MVLLILQIKPGVDPKVFLEKKKEPVPPSTDFSSAEIQFEKMLLKLMKKKAFVNILHEEYGRISQ